VTAQTRIVLASASPRRREILSQLGITFEVLVSDIDESQFSGEDPAAYVLRLSEAKARAVADRLFGGEPAYVLGADTTVVIDGEVLGKPSDRADSIRMLRMLSGRKHVVHTAVTLISQRAERVQSVAKATEVLFRSLSERAIQAYAASGEGDDKAGSYAIQGIGTGLVAEIYGSYSNVVGLPASETISLLEDAGAISSWPLHAS
jgi:septum formation protein